MNTEMLIFTVFICIIFFFFIVVKKINKECEKCRLKRMRIEKLNWDFKTLSRNFERNDILLTNYANLSAQWVERDLELTQWTVCSLKRLENAFLCAYNPDRESFYVKKCQDLINATWLVSDNFTYKRNHLLHSELKEACYLGFLENYISYVVELQFIINSNDDFFCLKLLNCEFSEDFYIFSDLIFILNDSVLIFIEDFVHLDDFENLKLFLNTAVNKKLNIQVKSLRDFMDYDYDGDIKELNSSPIIREKIFNVVNDFISNGMTSNGFVNNELADFIINSTIDKDFDLFNDTDIDMSDMF